MEINITKKDISWSYVAQFFNLATSFITLPVILKLLSADEVGFNYILVSINSIVVLFDMGFSGQFSRYLTYIFSGAQKIQKEGITEEYSDEINEQLLAITIKAAKSIYFVISLVAFAFLISLGTWYVYEVTEGFSIVNNAISIWCVSCVSSFFSIYYLYLNTFLQGRGLIKESKQAQVFSRLCQLAITFAMLFAGFGLLSVVVANLMAPFIFRVLAYKSFYTPYIKRVVLSNNVTKESIKEVFSILWHNAKKMGIIGILSSAIGYASTLVIGSYLSLSDVASYGLMVQLVGILLGIATIHFYSIVPKLSSLMVKKEYVEVRKHFGLSMFFFYIISALGMIAMILAVPVFNWCGFNTQLPSLLVIVIFYIYKFLEQNQSLFSQLFLFENDLRFYHSAIWTGIISFASLWLSLWMGYGFIGVVFSQSIPLLVYVAWKWPLEAIKTYGISVGYDFVIHPFNQIKGIRYGKLF